eukprot:NODE_1657_length_779_cov_99.372699_g1608_i0.p1 GENE.NODE_1657_length_779_cov_99.372699_g1608_i0~~NODE_1657_length_779_cov_99.372699_g1608_i0.p1  ORF type:complete len:236 (-),score=46.13 NODE_1657_length_779_cov_99.372699_g1608_i0:14-721(-)
MSSSRRILVVLTSHAELGSTGNKTGWYLPELAHPMHVLQEAGVTFTDLTFASPAGGAAPVDPGSVENFKEDPVCKNVLEAAEWKDALASTKKLTDVNSGDFDAIFYPGGHGPMFDLATDATSQQLIKEFFEAGKPVGAVCHGPAALVNVKLTDGSYLVKGKKVTCFSNAEEEAVKLMDAMPFPLESKLVENGGTYEKAPDMWAAHVVVDGNLITGQNPNSGTPIGAALAKALRLQ